MAPALVVLWAVLVAQAPDTARQARAGAAINRVTDSLTALQGAAAMFQADLINASPDLVISRAQRLTQRCHGTWREATRLDSVPGLSPRLHREIATLRGELARCEREFATGPGYQHADSVKAWAPYRLARLGDVVRQFRLAARAYLRPASAR